MTLREHSGQRPGEARRLLIHIGYHKTATTWLQNAVFLRKNGFNPLLAHSEVFDTVVHPHDLRFDAGAVASEWRRRQDQAMGHIPVDVLSLEALSGMPYTGGRESASYARRLSQVAPAAKILITIREQIDLIASVYMQYLYRAGTLTPERFFVPPGEPRPMAYRGYDRFDPETFQFHRLVALYRRLFGAGNVMVLPMEDIKSDQAAAVSRLAAFSGNESLTSRSWQSVRERGVSYPQYAVPAIRRANHFRRGPMNPAPMIDLGAAGDALYRGLGGVARRLPGASALKRRKPVRDVVAARYAGFFADSNRRLAEMLGPATDLSAYEGVSPLPEAPASGAERPPSPQARRA